jgi:hypothetical protein
VQTSHPQLHIQNNRTASLQIAETNISLILTRSISARSIGLLNHISLPTNEGIVLPKTRIIHSFGMRFPFIVLAFDSSGQQVCPPRLVPPSCFVRLPLKTRFTAEISSAHAFHLDPLPAKPFPHWLKRLLQFLLRT